MVDQARPQKRLEPPGAAKSQHYVLDDQIGFVVRAAMQRHTAIFMSLTVEGLTQPQLAALAKLLEVGPCSQNHLGRLIYLDAATTKGIIDRLRERGFVTTTNDPQDKRRRTIVLTDTGRQVTKAAVTVGAKITAETLRPLQPDEQKLVLRLLKKMS